MASQLRVDKIVPVDGVPTGGGGGIIQVVHSTATVGVSQGFSSDALPQYSWSTILTGIELYLYFLLITFIRS